MTRTPTTLLGRLRRDRRGNVMAMTAMATIPLLGMLGGALDMSRTYLVKSRLQHACDAAVLAGRRAMPQSGWNQSSETVAENFFNANFQPGLYGSEDVDMSYVVGSDQVVHGTAVANVPTTVMAIFGRDEIDLEATCQAELQLPNSDIMFVLDTTLSMNEAAPGGAGTGAASCTGSTAANGTKIAVLRAAVNMFYCNIEHDRGAGVQVRYGFVPYSNTVNVGRLLQRDWMVDYADYQSRELNKNLATGTNPPTNPPATVTDTGSSTYTGTRTSSTFPGRPENCVAPANENYTDNTTYTPWDPSSTALPRTRTVTRLINGTSYSAALDNSKGTCTITKIVYNQYKQVYTQTVRQNTNTQQTPGNTYHYWNFDYKQRTFDVRPFKGSASNGLMQGGQITPANFGPVTGARTDVPDTPGAVTARPVNWGNATNPLACIEERQTTRDTSYTTRPVNAYDLDVDMIPDPARPATQWRPYLPDLVYAREVTAYNASVNPATFYGPATVRTKKASDAIQNLSALPNIQAACPSASSKMAVMTAEQVRTYVAALAPRGRTYHDIGFLWGLRLMSPQGIFGAENQTTQNGGAITRHLIFMTDGQTETNYQDYDAYGLAAIDRRRTDANRLPTQSSVTSNEINPIIEARLTHLCNVAKTQKNITVWVVAFAAGLPANSPVRTCSSANRFYEANDTAALFQAFSDIADQIKQLRITR